MKMIQLGDQLKNFDSARRPIKSADRVGGDVPYLGASGVVDFVEGFTHEGQYLCVSEDGENLRSRRTPIAWVQTGQFWANNHLHILGGVSIARLKFFEAALAHADITGYLTGSAQPKLTQSALRAILIPAKSASEQAAIGEVLGALDEKIAANRRVQEASKELAVALAGRAERLCPIEDLALITKRSVAPKAMDEHVVHFSLPAYDEGAAQVEDSSTIKSSKLLLTDPVVLVSKLNPRFPRIWGIDALPNGMSVASTEFLPLRPREPLGVGALWAALSAQEVTARIVSNVAGTTGSHQRVRPDDLIAVTVPDVRTLPVEAQATLGTLCRAFNQVVAENKALAATRDELLPLLMTGKVTVTTAEKRVEEEV